MLGGIDSLSVSRFGASTSAVADLCSGSYCVAPCSYLLWDSTGERRGEGSLAEKRGKAETREVIDRDDRAEIGVDEKGTAAARTARRRRDSLILTLAWCNQTNSRCQALHDEEDIFLMKPQLDPMEGFLNRRCKWLGFVR